MVTSMHIIIADDHQIVRDGFKPHLGRLAPDIRISEAATLDEAIAAAFQSPPDLFLLDFNMPGMNGASGVDRVRTRFPRVPVVILSGDLAPENIRAVLNRGARGFIPKTLGGSSLLAALRLVLSGEIYIPSTLMVGRNGGRQRNAGNSASGTPTLDALTGRELEVLDSLCQGRSNKEIARDLAIAEVTVKAHVGNIMKKFGAANRTQVVRIALDLKAKSAP